MQGNELATPLLAALESPAESALVRPYGEETDDDHPKRDTEDKTREERVHDRRPFPPRWGRSPLLNRRHKQLLCHVFHAASSAHAADARRSSTLAPLTKPIPAVDLDYVSARRAKRGD